jgi:hypothetical protein
LPESTINIANVYRHYRIHCRERKYAPVSDFIFRRILSKEYNIGIHSPKKDKCSICVHFASLTSPTPEEIAQKNKHDAEKNAINAVYADCQKRSRERKSFYTTSFDLEKTLTTPFGKSVLFYYARKYAVYNLTFYESVTRQVYCYVWGESEGNRGSVEICSIMEKYLCEIDEKGTITKLALFCNNCAGQQKNIAMLAVIMKFIERAQNVKKVSLNFLLVGHTLMTVDSVHGAIERATRKKTVYAPSEWLTIIQNARYDPFPYTVVKLNHLDFRDWKTLGDKLNVKFCSSKEPFKISEVRRAIFTKDLSKNHSFKVIENATNPEEKLALIKPKRKYKFEIPATKYCNPVPISSKKFRDLVDLCTNKGAIPQHYHPEYLNLPHSVTTRDALLEPDEEEDDESIFFS